MGFDEGGDRIERAAANQSIFREVNERLQDLATAFQDAARRATFACECADVQCVEQLELSLDEYEAIRSEPNQFVVLPDHVYLDVERVVSENERFVAVAKIGRGATIAAEADPRS